MIGNRRPETHILVHAGTDVDFEAINEENIDHAKQVQNMLFPIHYPDSFYSELLCDSAKASYLFRARGEVIGICTLSTEAEYSRCYLMTFGILQQHRRRKVGTTCLLLLETLLAERYGIKEVYLHVLTTNLAARFFYVRLGYSFLKTEDDYYKNLPVKSAFLFVKNIK